jgi:8-oxo-dGTP pyrophosphatase MutT (NUDIX family)
MSKNERFKIFIAAYLILSKEGEVLLLKRANTGYQDGNYSLIAGHLDGAETAKQCIMREAQEEAGITLKQADLEVVHVMHRNSPDREYIDIYLQADNWEGEPLNLEPDKCDELKWYPAESMPDNIIPEVKLALKNITKKLFYGEIGW